MSTDQPHPSDGALWGAPPKRRRVRGSYTAAPYSGPGRFGAREAGSTLATGVLVQPTVLVTAAVLENMASHVEPNMTRGVVFGASYVGQLALTIGLKCFANALRSHGTSLVRDLGAWLWGILSAAIAWAAGYLASEASGAHHRPILDWLFPRR